MDWKNLLGSIAPTIATALGGPLAGTATKFLANHFLGDEDAPMEDIQAAVMGASPEQLAALKKIDADFKVEMERIGVDIFALEVEDRKSARDMAAKTSLVPQMILSCIYISGYFALIYLLLFGDVELKASISDMAKVLIGIMTTAIPMILQFWFGSSHGSKNKETR